MKEKPAMSAWYLAGGDSIYTAEVMEDKWKQGKHVKFFILFLMVGIISNNKERHATEAVNLQWASEARWRCIRVGKKNHCFLLMRNITCIFFSLFSFFSQLFECIRCVAAKQYSHNREFNKYVNEFAVQFGRHLSSYWYHKGVLLRNN